MSFIMAETNLGISGGTPSNPGLLLRPATRGQSGSYMCRARNAVGFGDPSPPFQLTITTTQVTGNEVSGRDFDPLDIGPLSELTFLSLSFVCFSFVFLFLNFFCFTIFASCFLLLLAFTLLFL